MLVVDGAGPDADAMVADDHLQLAAVERDLHVHRSLAATVGVQHHVVDRFAHGGFDVLDGATEVEALVEAAEHVADHHHVLRPAHEGHADVR